MKYTDVTDFLGITDTRKNIPVEPEHGKFDREELGPKKVLLSWEIVPEVGNKTIDPRYKRTFLIIGVIVALMLLAMKEIPLLLVVGSLFFISYVVSKNPPEKIKYEVTTHGIDVSDHFYYWDEITRFFFSKHFGKEIVALDLNSGLPSRIFLAFKQPDKEKLIEILNKYLHYLKEEPLNFMDKAYTSFLDKFDFEKKKN